MLAKQRNRRADRSHKTSAGSAPQLLALETGCQSRNDSADCPRHKEGLERNPACDSTRANADCDRPHSMRAFACRCGACRHVCMCSPAASVAPRISCSAACRSRAANPPRRSRSTSNSPNEFYVGAFVATADPNPGPSPDGRARCLGGPLLAPLGRLLRATCGCRSTPIPTIRGASATTAPSSPARWVFATSCSSRLSIRRTPRRSAPRRGYDEGNAWAVELSGRHSFNERFAISAGVGHYGLEEIYHDSYNYWNVTLTAPSTRSSCSSPTSAWTTMPREHFDAGFGRRPGGADRACGASHRPIDPREPDARSAVLMSSRSRKVRCRGTEKR